MTHPSLPAPIALPLALSLALFVSACGTQPKAPPLSHRGDQLELALASGNYSCEHGLHVRVEREMRDRENYRIQIAWNGNSYRLERDRSYSGLPRFEDSASGLVWIDLPWKSLLLDGRSNKPLANDCHSV